jgi:16S rRNA (cytosine1402-N4)-methyltransferase
MSAEIFENASDAPPMRHVSVLPGEILEFLAPERGGIYVDCTLGMGGHTEALLEHAPTARVIALDRDADAIAFAKRRLAHFGDRVAFAHCDFRALGEVLAERGVASVAGVLADLGVSSWQLDCAERGFSFQRPGPLDMRMDRSQPVTAASLVRTLSETELADAIYEYGEERFARRIARRIVEARRIAPIETTDRLADIVRRAIPLRGPQRIDPATRTFQALRIAVNEELENLDQFVRIATQSLAPGGRLAVITFHSLEDRIVKHVMRRLAETTSGAPAPYLRIPAPPERTPHPCVRILTRKPVTASAQEQQRNPRSRSAKLRVCERL